jgi:(p)ppGpp synthase/HD superfamily hydrolase
MVEIRRRSGSRGIIPAYWAATGDSEFLTTLRIEVNRQKGIIAEIASTISQLDAGVENIHVEERNAELTSVIVRLSIRDRNHLARVIRRLRNVPRVLSLNRVSV